MCGKIVSSTPYNNEERHNVVISNPSASMDDNLARGKPHSRRSERQTQTPCRTIPLCVIANQIVSYPRLVPQAPEVCSNDLQNCIHILCLERNLRIVCPRSLWREVVPLPEEDSYLEERRHLLRPLTESSP